VNVDAESVNVSVLDCMSVYGLIALSQQVPKSREETKSCSWNKKKSLPHGTNSQRITEACNQVPLSHSVNITEHSKNYFENCLNKVPQLFK
jgi:hypothetical protein